MAQSAGLEAAGLLEEGRRGDTTTVGQERHLDLALGLGPLDVNQHVDVPGKSQVAKQMQEDERPSQPMAMRRVTPQAPSRPLRTLRRRSALLAARQHGGGIWGASPSVRCPLLDASTGPWPLR